jgi:hypothetical protein
LNQLVHFYEIWWEIMPSIMTLTPYFLIPQLLPFQMAGIQTSVVDAKFATVNMVT